MELSSEDALRLHVLLANELEAVRIDESQMVVHALSSEGEAKVPLNPQGRDDQYLKKVRELLSSQVLGSPGGYPVFLRTFSTQCFCVLTVPSVSIYLQYSVFLFTYSTLCL